VNGRGQSHRHYRVLVFPTRGAAESGFQQLLDAGVDVRHASLFIHAHTTGLRKDAAADHAVDVGGVSGAGFGATIGAVGGVLAGLGLLAIPGVGPLLALGPVATAITGAISGGAFGGFAGALAGLGVAEARAVTAEQHLKAGRSLIIVDGKADAQTLDAIERSVGAIET
jgi:hypothetical protein